MVASWRATVSTKGYRFTTTISIGSRLCSRNSCTCVSLSRRARMPLNIAGCRVLTRPPSISGNPVSAVTISAGMPASCSALAVPLVEKTVMLWDCNSRANGTSPSRLATLTIARIAIISFRLGFWLDTPHLLLVYIILLSSCLTGGRDAVSLAGRIGAEIIPVVGKVKLRNLNPNPVLSYHQTRQANEQQDSAVVISQTY